MTTLGLLLLAVEVVTVIWGVNEYLGNRDFKAKAEVWLRDTQGISNACSVLKGDCEQGKVESAQEAGGQVGTIGSAVYSLFKSIEDTLERPTAYDRMVNLLSSILGISSGSDPPAGF